MTARGRVYIRTVYTFNYTINSNIVSIIDQIPISVSIIFGIILHTIRIHY